MGAYFKAYFLITVICVIFLYFNLRCRDRIVLPGIVNNFDYVRSHIEDEMRPRSTENITDSDVICVIMTSEKTFLERSITVWQTWARKCHKALFACNCANLTKIMTSNQQSIFKNLVEFQNALEVPIWQLQLTEKYDHMADKVFTIVSSLYKQYGDQYKWFLLTDDDTFTFVDNMHAFTANRSYKDPLTYGYNYKVIVPTGYHSGGGGVLFTHEAIKRINANIEKGVCAEKEGYGDVALGFCAYKSNVTMGNSLDEKGRERFHPLDYIAHHRGYIPDWLTKYSSNGVKTGHECCSDESITFHYTSVEQMKFFGSLKDQKVFKEIYRTFN